MKRSSNSQISGHLMAIFSIIVWGGTFITTKSLLTIYSPFEILLYRFLIGYAALLLLSPHHLRFTSFRNEFLLFLSGASGVTIYFLCENTALSYTYASNVSIIVSTAPFFTGLLALLIYKEKMKSSFVIGFLVALTGIILITYSGSSNIQIRPIGDLLAVGCAVCWGIYSITTSLVRHSESESIAVTRRIFFYGLVTMIPILIWKRPRLLILTVHDKDPVFMLLFLGIVASALCYLTWNRAMQILGATRTSVYIYLIPVVALIFSYMFLNERLTLYSGLGCFLILLGLCLSEIKRK